MSQTAGVLVKSTCSTSMDFLKTEVSHMEMAGRDLVTDNQEITHGPRYKALP